MQWILKEKLPSTQLTSQVGSGKVCFRTSQSGVNLNELMKLRELNSDYEVGCAFYTGSFH